MGYVIYKIGASDEGVTSHIVSNYTDLEVVNEKRICRAYMDIESEYSTTGTLAIERDYNINDNIHTDDETAEPDGAVSRQTFYHTGRKTWNTTNDFDSAVEAWNFVRLDIGLVCNSFRYSIKIENVPRSGHGVLRFRPPRFLVQVKSQR